MKMKFRRNIGAIWIIFALLPVVIPRSACGEEAGGTAPAGRSATGESRSLQSSDVPAADAALFISGRAVAAQSPLSALEKESVWKQFAGQMDEQWRTLERKRLGTMQQWGSKELKPLLPEASTLFYMFSGPDFVSADALFPHMSVYILCGLEPIGSFADVKSLSPAALASNLHNLIKSLKSIIYLSFFRTLDMEVDLQKGEISGVWPILYIFLVRTGHEVLNADRVFLDGEGTVKMATPQEPPPPKSIEGIRIRFEGHGMKSQELYYFKANVADSALKKNESFLKFLGSRGKGLSYLKAASYLLHKGYFSLIREFLLSHSLAVLQDDSGIPYRFFDVPRWQTTLYGSYVGVLELFKEHYQANLRRAYMERNDIKALPFVTGYTFLHKSNVLLAVVKTPVPEATP